MKNLTRGVLLLFVVLAASAIQGGQPAVGVAGVDVTVKQNPSKRTTTDARGNFVFDALPPGPCTLTFRARKATDTKTTSTEKLTVAASYSIKVEGTKRPVNQSGLGNNQMSAGVDISVDVGSGAKIRGQVLAGGTKRMVWVRKTGSQLPGRWVEEGSEETANNVNTHSAEDFRPLMNRNANMRDPLDSFKPATR